MALARGRPAAALRTLRDWWRLARPLFLVGGVVFYSLGAVMAWRQSGSFDPHRWLLGQLTVTLGQLMTHFTNDYFDLAADRELPHRPKWSGGSGVLPAGAIAPTHALGAGVVTGLAAVGVAAWIALDGPAPIQEAALLAVCLGLAWGYSAPPTRLHSTGLGEIVGALLIAGLTPGLGYALQRPGELAADLLLLGPLVLLQLQMLVTVSLPDIVGDAAVGKRTLAARIGTSAAGRLATAAIALAFGLVPLIVAAGANAPAAFGILAWLPLGLFHSRALLRQRATWPVDEVGRLQAADAASFWSIGLVVGPATTALVAIAMAGR